MAKWISSSNSRVTKYGGLDTITSCCLEMSLRKNIHVTEEIYSHMTIKENAFSKHSHFFVCSFLSLTFRKKFKKKTRQPDCKLGPTY